MPKAHQGWKGFVQSVSRPMENVKRAEFWSIYRGGLHHVQLFRFLPHIFKAWKQRCLPKEQRKNASRAMGSST